MLVRSVGRLCLLGAVAGAVLATPIPIASDGTLADPFENNTTPDPQGIGDGTTIIIDSHPAWAAPFAGSNWVSYAQTGGVVSGGNPAYVVPNQVVITFRQQFFLPAAGSYHGVLSVMADDSTAVILNGRTMVAEASAVNNYYRTCSDYAIGCLDLTSYTFVLPNDVLQPGQLNTLEFEVAQRNGVSFGLNYSGYVATPEPALVPVLCVVLAAFAYAKRARKA